MKSIANKIFGVVSGGLLFLQIVFQVYFNVSDIRLSLDEDVCSTFYHYMEVLKNGTLKLPDWYHTTSLELDGAFLFAIPLYYITEDLFLAVGISNIVLAYLYMAVIYRIMCHVGVEKNLIFATIAMVLTPYSFGMLEYYNMMFFGGACYSIRTLVPMIFILLILLLSEKAVNRKNNFIEFILWTILYIILLFFTTFSTGYYTVMCGILPLLICMLVDIWKDGTLNKKYNMKHLVLILGSFLAFVVGFVLYKDVYPGGTNRTNMFMTKNENFAVNFRACIAGIWNVFGAMTSDSIGIMSVEGIIYSIKFALVTLIMIVFVYNVLGIFKKTERFDVRKYLSIIFLFNFLLLVVTDSRYGANKNMEYRYFIIGLVPLIVLLGIQIYEWKKKWNLFQIRMAYTGLAVVLGILILGNNWILSKEMGQTTYSVEVCEYFETLDVESIFFVNDKDTAVLCKGIDFEHKYGSFMTETQTISLEICSYHQSTSGSFYGDKNALAVITGNDLADLLPSSIADKYTKIGTVKWYDIYVADKVYFP